MKLEYFSDRKLKKKILDVLGKYLPPSSYSLFFFGSRVKGDSQLHSDIDLGIMGRRKIPAKIKLAIEEELESLPVLYKIELVDFADVSDEFKKEALKFSERIN